MTQWQKTENDKWWWRNDDWFSTQLIIQLVTKNPVWDFISRFFLQQMPPKIIVARAQRTKNTRKATKNINVWHHAADFSSLFFSDKIYI